jgi:hypothetical protein
VTRASVALGFALAVVSGCAAPIEDESLGAVVDDEVEPELIGGEKTTRFRAIGRLDVDFDGHQGTCTATLVGPAVALTAAHCVGFANGVDRPNRKVRLVLGARRHRAVEWRVFGRAYGRRDLALLRLDEKSSIRPFAIATAPPDETPVRAVGFGGSRCKYDGDHDQKPVKRWLRFTWRTVSPDLDVLCRGDSGGPVIGPEGVFAVASAIRADAVDRSREDLFAHVEAAQTELRSQLERWNR